MSAMDVPIDRSPGGAAGGGGDNQGTSSGAVHGELAIISVYCPDQLQEFQEYRDSLDTADVVG